MTKHSSKHPEKHGTSRSSKHPDKPSSKHSEKHIEKPSTKHHKRRHGRKLRLPSTSDSDSSTNGTWVEDIWSSADDALLGSDSGDGKEYICALDSCSTKGVDAKLHAPVDGEYKFAFVLTLHNKFREEKAVGIKIVVENNCRLESTLYAKPGKCPSLLEATVHLQRGQEVYIESNDPHIRIVGIKGCMKGYPDGSDKKRRSK